MANKTGHVGKVKSFQSQIDNTIIPDLENARNLVDEIIDYYGDNKGASSDKIISSMKDVKSDLRGIDNNFGDLSKKIGKFINISSVVDFVNESVEFFIHPEVENLKKEIHVSSTLLGDLRHMIRKADNHNDVTSSYSFSAIDRSDEHLTNGIKQVKKMMEFHEKDNVAHFIGVASVVIKDVVIVVGMTVLSGGIGETILLVVLSANAAYNTYRDGGKFVQAFFFSLGTSFVFGKAVGVFHKATFAKIPLRTFEKVVKNSDLEVEGKQILRLFNPETHKFVDGKFLVSDAKNLKIQTRKYKKVGGAKMDIIKLDAKPNKMTAIFSKDVILTKTPVSYVVKGNQVIEEFKLEGDLITNAATAFEESIFSNTVGEEIKSEIPGPIQELIDGLAGRSV